MAFALPRTQGQGLCAPEVQVIPEKVLGGLVETKPPSGYAIPYIAALLSHSSISARMRASLRQAGQKNQEISA